MKLYRGDSLPSHVRKADRKDRGRTFAEHFCGNGLMSKFTDGSSSTLLRGKQRIDMILSHVGYERDKPEELFAYRSPFLSFTSEITKAFKFSERTGKKNLERCHLDVASYFIWELDIDLPDEAEAGRYEFLYKASSVNCKPHVMGQIQRGRELEAQTGNTHVLAVGLMNLIAGRVADNDPRDHFAELIHVVPYVTQHNTTGRDPRLVHNTLDRASRDYEWLLYPTDPMEDGIGVSSRFAMNQHLRVYECYRIQSCKEALGSGMN